MYKRTGFILIAVFWLGICNLPFFGSQSQAQTFEQAAELVLNTVVQPDNAGELPIIAFGLPNALQAGDVIQPYNFLGKEPIPGLREIEEETWFFWIDDAPGAHYTHPNRFVFVSRESGQVSVSEEGWWPMLNGENLWTSDEDYQNPDNWIYSNVNAEETNNDLSFVAFEGHFKLASLTRPQQERNPLQALVINLHQEGERGKKDFAADARQMEDRLRTDGFQTTEFGTTSDSNPNNSGTPHNPDSERISLQPWAMWLDERAASMQPGDTLVFYMTGHGENAEGEGRVGPAPNSITENALAGRLAKFDPGVNIIVIIEACESGAFTDGLKPVADLTLTSSAADEPSYGDLDITSAVQPPMRDLNPKDEGGEFTSSIIEEWDEIKQDPARQQQIEQTAQDQNVSYWEAFFSESFFFGMKYNLTTGYTGPLSTQPQFSSGRPATNTTSAGFERSDNPVLVIDRTTPCLGGPGSAYPTHSTLEQGTQAYLVSGVFGGGWVIAVPYQGEDVQCWLDTDDVTIDGSLILAPDFSVRPDELNDGLNCQTGEPYAGETPPELDIVSAGVDWSDLGPKITFTVEGMDVQGKELWGGVAFYDPSIPLSEPNPKWYFSGRSNLEWIFHLDPPNLIPEVNIYDQNEGWREDLINTFQVQLFEDTFVIDIPVEDVPKDSAYYISLTNFEVCEEWGLGEFGLPGAWIPPP